MRAAVKQWKKVSQTLEKKYGFGHISTIRAQNQYGEALSKAGKWRKAEDLWRGVVKERKRLSGMSSALVEIQTSLVESMKEQREFERVRREEWKLVEWMEEVEGRESEKTIRRKKIHVKTLLRLKRHREAEELSRVVVEGSRKCYGAEHRKTKKAEGLLSQIEEFMNSMQKEEKKTLVESYIGSQEVEKVEEKLEEIKEKREEEE